jgi:RNA polymerase sigma-70 factor (ECF subfamily)
MDQSATSGKWLEEHWDALYRYALIRVRDETLAEDLVQETLLAAFKNNEQFENRSSPKTWLVGILKHKIIDAIRKSSREFPLMSESDALSEALIRDSFDERQHWQVNLENWSDPDKSLEQQQFWIVLNECIDRLPPQMAQIFMLRELDGLDSNEICKIAGLSSTNNLWVTLSRIRMRMRECLASRWFTNP